MSCSIIPSSGSLSSSDTVPGITPERLKTMLEHLIQKSDSIAAPNPEPTSEPPEVWHDPRHIERQVRSVPDSVLEMLAPKPLIAFDDFAMATGCERMLKGGYKRAYMSFCWLGEIKIIRDRWQITVRSSTWPERALAPAVIIRDLTKEAGFAHMGICPALSGADELCYAFDRAFAGVRVADLQGMIAPSAKDICERLNWRAQFKSSRDNRSFASLTLVGLINMKSDGFHLADGKVTFEPMPGTETKPALQKRYQVKLTLRRHIDGFKVPLVGHGWSCMPDHERPSHLQGVTFNSQLKEVPGSSSAAH